MRVAGVQQHRHRKWLHQGDCLVLSTCRTCVLGWGGGVGGGVGNTPRTRGPLLRCGGHGRRCHGPDTAHALAFRLTGVGEDVGHTV